MNIFGIFIVIFFSASIQGSKNSKTDMPKLCKRKSVFHLCVEKNTFKDPRDIAVATWLQDPHNHYWVNMAEPEHQETPLFAAIRNQDVPMTHLLLAYGARIDITNKYGKTPIDVARALANTQILELLCKPDSQ